jgi:hypothetical protein
MEKMTAKIFIVRNTKLGGINSIIKNFFEEEKDLTIISLTNKEENAFLENDNIIYFPLLNKKSSIIIRILNKVFPYLFVRSFNKRNTKELVSFIEKNIGVNFKAYICGFGAYSNFEFKSDERLILVSHSINSKMLESRCPKYLIKINIKILKSIIPNRFIAVSNAIKKDWEKILNEGYEVKVINNPLKIDSDVKNRIIKKNPYYVFCGRLSIEKNIFSIIEYFISSDLKGVQLIIIGDGPEKNNLKKYIIKNKLEDIVILKGYVANPFSIMQSAQCLILNSHYEGYPSVINESLLLSTKVVIGECGGAAYDIIPTEYHNYILKKNDKKSFVKTFKSIQNNNYPLFKIHEDDFSVSKALLEYEKF